MRLLVVATTPGPAKSLADAIKMIQADFEVSVLSSSDEGHGRGGKALEPFGIVAVPVESVLDDYTPLDVTDRQAEILLERFAPDVVLVGAVRDATGEARTLEDVVSHAAGSKGISSFQFIEGWDIWYPRKWCKTVAGKFLVIDEPAKQLMVHHGAEPESVCVVGYPRSLFSPAVIDHGKGREVRERFMDANDKRLIVYLGQVSPDNPRTLGWVSASCSAGDVLLYQRHPRDPRPGEELFRHCANVEAVDSPIDTHLALHGADCCVSHYSLSSFTAAYLGIPTILTLLPDDVPRIRESLGAYPTTVMKGTVEAFDLASFQREFGNMKKPSSDFLKSIGDSMAQSTGRIAAELLQPKTAIH